MSATSYLDQVIENYKCGDYNVGLKSSNPEQEALTNLVLIKLKRASVEQATFFANHISKPTLQEYLDRLSCGGQDKQLSNAEALYIETQIELMYLEVAQD